MSEDSSAEKTEEPTSKRIKDARERGQVAQSKDVNKFVIILVVTLYFLFAYRYFVGHLADNYTKSFITIANRGQSLELPAMLNILLEDSVTLFWLLVPVFLAAIVGFLMNLWQVGGFIISKEVIKLDGLNPVNNFKQLFSMRNLVKFVKNVFEITIMLIVAGYMLKTALPDLLLSINDGLTGVVFIIAILVLKIVLVLLLIYFVCAILDYILERRTLFKQLKMTKDEVKRELKDTEGNPEIKQRRQELHQEILEEGGVADTLKHATLVLANPTHIAIVILYSPLRWQLPVVLIKSKGLQAQLVFKLARTYKVPIIRDKLLARSLYQIAEIGKFIPASLLASVGTVINKNIDLLPNVVKELTTIKQQRLSKQQVEKVQ